MLNSSKRNETVWTYLQLFHLQRRGEFWDEKALVSVTREPTSFSSPPFACCQRTLGRHQACLLNLYPRDHILSSHSSAVFACQSKSTEPLPSSAHRSPPVRSQPGWASPWLAGEMELLGFSWQGQNTSEKSWTEAIWLLLQLPNVSRSSIYMSIQCGDTMWWLFKKSTKSVKWTASPS